MEDTILQERTQMIDQPKETVVPSARETEDAILQERTDLIAQLKETVGPSGIGNGSPPLNIVFVGAPGCGKSSFINSFAASVADECWREYACSGRRGGGVTHQNTVRIQSVVATNYGTSPSVRDYSLPTLIDLTGFENQDEEITKEVLRLIFYGKLRNASNLNSVYRFGKTFGVWALRLWYGVLCTENHFKVDRVVIVASANEEVPEGLFNGVMEVVRPTDDVYNREIPVFGVMTGIDVIDESHTEVFEERKINFMNSLALVGAGHRFLQCVNYCDEVDPTRKRICQTLPHIDVPILKFMNVVCGRHYGVVNSEESYRDVLRLQLRHQIRCWVVNLCKRVATSFTNSTRGPVVPANPPGVDMITILLCVFVCLLFCVVFSIVFL
ncbi:uncharacterized protein LOC110455179 isoform X1 [Mizuhopecten yessoensis]|uniref:uncharacterized protein LOC110455179 isoform X1 n=1 Tax=Mizuhopecten yessoensis TaxID=6573 RepID=UPI000B45AC19|nr:uncharacterized protein LOC110455179 isoform X1 [Mizuhopecten yessoensis]